jgi:Zn ribbon nucleic-acid-binding protein
MTGPTRWQTDDPCPSCGTTLTLTDDGGSVIRVECRSCGHADTWTSGPPGPGDQLTEARQASQWLLAEYDQDEAALKAGLTGRLTDDAQQKRFLRVPSPGPMLTLKDG